MVVVEEMVEEQTGLGRDDWAARLQSWIELHLVHVLIDNVGAALRFGCQLGPFGHAESPAVITEDGRRAGQKQKSSASDAALQGSLHERRVTFFAGPVDFQTREFDHLTGDGHVARYGLVDQTGLCFRLFKWVYN